MKFRHISIVHVLGELVSCPLFFTIGEIEFTNRVTIEGSLVPFNHRVMAIDSHSGMIMRDGKGELAVWRCYERGASWLLRCSVCLWGSSASGVFNTGE